MGGNAHPSGTVVTAEGNVVVVVDDVVVVTRGATQPTTGIVVAVPSVEGGHKTGTDDVVVVVAPDAAMGDIATTAAANNGKANRERRIPDTLVMVNAHDWALQQRYWSYGIQPDSQTNRPQVRHLVCRCCRCSGFCVGCVGFPRLIMARNIWDGELHGEIDVRRVQPYEALKQYICPGCDRDIPSGMGHVVAVPRDAPDLRRHWHKACWERRSTGKSR